MKLTCTKENLGRVLSLVSGVAGKQTNLPILEHVMITASESKVECIATNLEMAVKAVVRAKVDEVGTFTVPAKTLAEYVALLRGDQVVLSVEGNELLVESGSSKTRIKGAASDEFPVFPEVEDGTVYSVLAESYADALKKVLISVSKNDVRPELSGVYCGFFTNRFAGLVMAGTDSYRLSEKMVSVASGADERRFILPARTATEVVRLISVPKDGEGESVVRICVTDNQILFRYNSFELTSRLVEGKYPDYTQIIPETHRTTALLPVENVVNEVKAAGIFSTTGVNAVLFDVKPEEHVVSIASESMQRGAHAATVDAEVTGETVSILLNHRYVLDGLAHVETDDVSVGLNGSDMPCVFRPKGKQDFLYIVMPIRK
jgi:DNA polymerase III subunit beta